MKTIWTATKSTICILLVSALLFVSGYYVGKMRLNAAELVPDATSDVKLPTEVEKRVVTKEDVETQLVEISELSTYSSEYTVTKSVDFTRYLLDDIPIPGTTNTVELNCTGVVKVGYNINDIVVKVNSKTGVGETGGTIYISLPSPTVNDNYLIWDKVDCKEANSILNPIDFEQYKTLISEIEATGLDKAEENGIYDAAEKNLKNIIENFLAKFEDYDIVFM